MNKKEDYGTKVLKYLHNKIEKMPDEELEAIIKEADAEFKKLIKKRGKK